VLAVGFVGRAQVGKLSLTIMPREGPTVRIVKLLITVQDLAKGVSSERHRLSRGVVLTLLLALSSSHVLGQDSLTLSPALLSQSATATLSLNLSSATGSEPSAVQFSLIYTPADIVSISAVAGTSAAAAGKSMFCSGSAGEYACVVAGLNTAVISNGSLAAVTVTLMSGVTSAAIGVTNTLGASASGIAVGINGIGGTVSAATNSPATGHPPFFTGEVYLGGGVYHLQFPDGNLFGNYNYQYFPVVFHYDLGLEYFLEANDGKAGAYLYDLASGHWFYTSPSLFPYLYDFTLNNWLYYFLDAQNPGHYTTNPRYFSNVGTGQIFTM
jgi:hypothetical protein